MVLGSSPVAVTISLWWLVFVLFELYATPGNGLMFCFCHRENQIDSQEHIHHFYWEEEESFECGYLDHYSYRQKTSWSCWVLPELINFKWKLLFTFKHVWCMSYFLLCPDNYNSMLVICICKSFSEISELYFLFFHKS